MTGGDLTLGTAGVLAAAAVLSATAVFRIALRAARTDPTQPDRLVAELHVARWAAVLLSAVGALTAGAAIGSADPLAGADVACGVIFVGVAGIVLQRDPREALVLAAAAFVAHALLMLAHRPGWLSTEVVARRLAVGVSIYDVCVAAACFWVRRQ